MIIACTRIRQRPGRPVSFASLATNDFAVTPPGENHVGTGGPGVRLTRLGSTGVEAPGFIALRAEVSAARRDDARLEDAVGVPGWESAVRSVRWSIQDQAAAGWTGPGTHQAKQCRMTRCRQQWLCAVEPGGRRLGSE